MNPDIPLLRWQSPDVPTQQQEPEMKTDREQLDLQLYCALVAAGEISPTMPDKDAYALIERHRKLFHATQRIAREVREMQEAPKPPSR